MSMNENLEINVQNETLEQQETVDGFLVNIVKKDIHISGEQAGQINKLPGYTIKIAIPDWDQNKNWRFQVISATSGFVLVLF